MNNGSLEEYKEILIELYGESNYDDFINLVHKVPLKSYMKQISTSNPITNTILSIDYAGGNDIYIDDFADAANGPKKLSNKTTDINSVGLSYVSGASRITDPNYNSDEHEITTKYQNPMFFTETAKDGGLSFGAENNSYGSLNLDR
jgi:hypothetical protein